MAEGTWIDAFVTKPAKTEADVVFMGSVMSVVPVKSANGGGDWDHLEIRDESTVWITPRWFAGTVNYYDGSSAYDDFLHLQKGDLIYIGHNIL